MTTAATVAKIKKKSQVTGNVGLYYVAYRLSLLGWNVMPTARNAKGVDLIAYDTEAENFQSIQVKALSKRNPVPLGASLSNVQAHFWVIVTGIDKAPGTQPEAFVLTPEEVKSLASRYGEGDKAAYWLDPKKYHVDEYRERWDRFPAP